MRIGILTGGGDCPGLNVVIRAVVRMGIRYGYEIIGIKDGWKGLIEKSYIPLDMDSAAGLLPRGGTILGTSRTNPFKSEDAKEKVVENVKEIGLDCIVAVGGDDTLGVANKFFKLGIKIIGVPKTIDNDLSGTDFTFGFDTAVSIVTEALDRLHTTTEAHHRAIVVEVMGRHAGWIATYGGLAGGADFILIPERPFDIEDICDVIKERGKRGRYFSIIVAAEGAIPKEAMGVISKDAKADAFGHVRLGGIGEYIAEEVEKRTGIESRHVVLGHLQRGGSPTAYDRILATRFGVKTVELIREGKFGRMVALKGNSIVDIPLEEGTKKLKLVNMDIYRIAEVFFG